MNVKLIPYSHQKIDIKVRPKTMKEDAIRLAQLIRPDWIKPKIKTKFFTDGTTNQLMGCYVEENKCDIILIRIYGSNTQLFIDRNQEINNLQLMNKYYLSPPLFASFQNGICYGFIQGTVITQEMVKDDQISFNICKMMAKMHSISYHEKKDQNLSQASLFTDLRKYLNLIMPSTFVFFQNQKKFIQLKSLTINDLKKEVDFLEVELTKLNSPIVFAHNDLLLKNIIYNKKKQSIFFIDFEYASYNFQAFDIANHFCEFAGTEPYNYNLYPDETFQLKWLKNYLYFWKYYQSLPLSYSQKDQNNQKTYDTCNNHVLNNVDICDLNYSNKIESNFFTNHYNNQNFHNSDQEINRLYVEVTKFTLASHLFWGIWALLQSQYSSIKFNFKNYAISRIQEYYRNKDKILSLNFDVKLL